MSKVFILEGLGTEKSDQSIRRHPADPFLDPLALLLPPGVHFDVCSLLGAAVEKQVSPLPLFLVWPNLEFLGCADLV